MKIHLVIRQREKGSLCWSFHLKLTLSLPSRGPEADPVSNSKLSRLHSTHQAWCSHLYHKLVHQLNTISFAATSCAATSFNTTSLATTSCSTKGHTTTFCRTSFSTETSEDQQPASFTASWKRPGPFKRESLLSMLPQKSLESHEVLKSVHLQAYYEDDLSLCPEDEINKAMLKEGENLQGTYEPVSKSSFTPQQLKQVIQTR